MLNTLSMLTLHLVLILHPAEISWQNYPVLNHDPGFFLVLADTALLQQLDDDLVAYVDLGEWASLYPSAVVTLLSSDFLPPSTVYYERNNRFLIPWSEGVEIENGEIVVLPEWGIKPVPRKMITSMKRGSALLNLSQLFPRNSFDRYLNEVSGELPFYYEDEEIYLYSRSIDQMVMADHPEAMAVEYLYQALTNLGYEAEILPFAVPYCAAHRNVAVTIPGFLYPDEYVYVTAHFDDRPFRGNAPGADDNGTGVTSLLVLAETLRCLPTQRSVRLVWFSAEEVGLCGSKGLLQDMNQEERSRIIANVNGDMFGYDGNGDGYFQIHAGLMASSQELGNIMVQAVADYAIPLVPDLLTEDATGASDHSTFWLYGIPAVEIGEDFHFDFNPLYHQSGDTVENMHPDYAHAIGQAMTVLLFSLANPDDTTVLPPIKCFDNTLFSERTFLLSEKEN